MNNIMVEQGHQATSAGSTGSVPLDGFGVDLDNLCCLG